MGPYVVNQIYRICSTQPADKLTKRENLFTAFFYIPPKTALISPIKVTQLYITNVARNLVGRGASKASHSGEVFGGPHARAACLYLWTGARAYTRLLRQLSTVA